AKGFTGKLGADELLALPLFAALADMDVRRWYVPRQRHQQGNRMLGRADGVTARRVHDDDAAARGGGDVNVVHADPGPDDGFELTRVFEQLGRDLGGAADNDAVGGANGFLQGRSGQAGPLVKFDPGLAEQVESRGFQFIANENARHD